jgi:hypothetical protein
MSFLAHALVVMLVAAGILLLAGTAVFFVTRGYLRRRWRGIRTHVATRGAVATWSMAVAWRERSGARLTPEELSQGSPAHARRRMWAAIEDAEEAVQHADTVNASVAELPAVCRSLRTVGGELDQLLQLERRLPASRGRPDEVRAQVAEVIQASRDVQLAALRAAGDANQPQLRSLVRDARDEVEIVASTLRRMGAAQPHET